MGGDSERMKSFDGAEIADSWPFQGPTLGFKLLTKPAPKGWEITDLWALKIGSGKLQMDA